MIRTLLISSPDAGRRNCFGGRASGCLFIQISDGFSLKYQGLKRGERRSVQCGCLLLAENNFIMGPANFPWKESSGFELYRCIIQ